MELEILEQAAELVVKEEEEEDDDDDDDEDDEEEDSSSSSDSEEDSEDSEEEKSDTSTVPRDEEKTEKNQTEVGPLHPQVNWEALQEDSVTESSPLPAAELQRGGGEQREPSRLIEELGERLEEGLKIEEDVPRARHSIRGTNTEGERERRRKEGEDCHQSAAGAERGTTKTASSRELLMSCLQRNPLHIITTDELDSDDDEESLRTVSKEGS